MERLQDLSSRPDVLPQATFSAHRFPVLSLLEVSLACSDDTQEPALNFNRPHQKTSNGQSYRSKYSEYDLETNVPRLICKSTISDSVHLPGQLQGLQGFDCRQVLGCQRQDRSEVCLWRDQQVEAIPREISLWEGRRTSLLSFKFLKVLFPHVSSSPFSA